MNEPITYLVANYNQERYIQDCIESLYQQTSPRWRCLIVDDASTDQSLVLIRKLSKDNRIQVIEHKQNRGYIGALKTMLAHATTDIVAILDPDDMLVPEATACLAEVYARQEAGFVYSRHAEYDEHFQQLLRTHCRRVPAGKTSLQFGWVSHLWSFRRQVYDQTIGFDESMLYAEDRDLVLKLEEVAQPIFIDKILYKRRHLAHSQSHDSRKALIGMENFWQAQRDALQRRNITGFHRWLYEPFFCLRYLSAHPKLPYLLRRLCGITVRGMEAVDGLLSLRKTGELRRENVLPIIGSKPHPD